MRRAVALRRLAASLAVAALATVASPAGHSQTVIVPGASNPAVVKKSPARRPPARSARPAHGRTLGKTQYGPPKPPPAPPRPVTPIPPAPPPAPVLPPPLVVPTRPPPPPPPPAIVAPSAPGEASPRKDGLRLTFGPGAATLNPATEAAVRQLVHTAGAPDATTYTVTAYAAETPDDTSAPRRLSLSRALAVRSILITEGVASVRIYVKALGPPPAGDTPADRVDIVTASNPATPR